MPDPNRRLVARLAAAILPPLLLLAGLDRWRAAVTYDRAEAVFDLIADHAVPLVDLIMGPSLAGRSIDPAALGPTFWNLGVDGARASYLRAQDALLRRDRPAPRRIVLVQPWFAFKPGAGWREMAHDTEFLSWGDRAALGGPWDLALANLFPLWKQRDRLLLGMADPEWTEGLGYRATRGFAPYRNERKPLSRLEANVALPDLPAAEAEAGELLDALRAGGTRVALVHLPTYAPSTPEHAAARAAWARLAAARGIPRLDYERDARLGVDDDPTAFRDWVHLNAAASERASRLLGRDLRRIGFLAAGS